MNLTNSMMREQSISHSVRLSAWRRRALLIFLLLGFVLLMLQSLYLQNTNKVFLQKKGSDRYSRTLQLQAYRGKISDRNGEILAVNSPVESVWVNPSVVEMSAQQKKMLTKLLDIKTKEINEMVANKKRSFVYVKRRIPPDLAEQVEKLDIEGIHLQREYRRFYPAGDVMAHVVGFTGVDGDGQEGIELKQNKMLSGVPGKRRVIKDRAGHVVEELEVISEPRDGEDLVLSIDRRIQYLAFRELAKAVTQLKAKAASAVILDAKTGEVLAMVNLPTYNPNNPVNIKGKTRNRAVTDMFEPGSTMKPFVAAAGIQYGGYEPSTMIDTSPGYMKIGPATIHDTHPHKMLSVAGVVQKSSNVGAAKIALSLEKEKLWHTFRDLGFGARTQVHFPGEARGVVRDYKSWRPIEQATMSYGHGISVTLLQLARAYTVFANNGRLMPVSLQKLDKQPAGTEVFSSETANAVKKILEMVVQPGGTGVNAQIAGYRVAGKTGTAHKLGEHGYEHDKYVGSFVGMVPVSNPRLIMAVMIDEPKTGQYYGGTVAAPVFSAVMAEVLRLLAVPQDAPNNNVVIPAVSDPDDVKEMV